jgi:galactokinase
MTVTNPLSASQDDRRSRDAGEVYGAPPPSSAPFATWCQAMEKPSASFAHLMRVQYGDEQALIAERRALYGQILNAFGTAFGEEGQLFLLAVPSRINWEGHHVDHQGGSYNSTTHYREMILAVRARSDRRVRLVNAEPQRFGQREFSLDEELPEGQRGRDWSNYVRGAFAALARRHPGTKLLGADIAVGSDIPVGASLSSSHALVLGSALGTLAVNSLTLDKRDAVMLVQEGEWYTGSRTGLGDQASMVYGRRGKLFSSPVVERDGMSPRYVDLPKGHAHLIIDSYTEHHLQGEERMGYNARVFAYKTAFPLVLSAIFEDGAPRAAVAATRRLVDIRPDRFPTEAIYRALRRLPDVLTLPEARRLFEKACETLGPAGVPLKVCDFDALVKTYFGDGPFPERMAIKGVAMYGLAECWRSRLYADLLERGDFVGAGRLADCGHDGDRVSARDAKTGKHVPLDHPVTDATLDDLLARLADRDDKRRASAALELQPGDYHASLIELDELVDLCRESGAVSASLTGAGLGGVVTVVIADERAAALREKVIRHFEAAEDGEVALVEAAVRDGRLPAGTAAVVRALRDRKRAARNDATPFAFSAAEQETLARCVKTLVSGNNELVRLLGADYYREGLARNVSVAGAGFLPTP